MNKNTVAIIGIVVFILAGLLLISVTTSGSEEPKVDTQYNQPALQNTQAPAQVSSDGVKIEAEVVDGNVDIEAEVVAE